MKFINVVDIFKQILFNQFQSNFVKKIKTILNGSALFKNHIMYNINPFIYLIKCFVKTKNATRTSYFVLKFERNCDNLERKNVGIMS